MIELILGIANAFRIEVFELGVLVLFLIVAVIIGFGIRSVAKTEAFKRLTMFLPVLDTFITSLIKQVADNDTLVDWESERAMDLGIDPRMLYVLEKLESLAESRGIDLEFELLYLRAQDIYDGLVEDGTIY